MQSELGKCHSGGVFTKFRLVVKRKGGNYLELKLFTRGILCGASGGVKTLPHVYLGLAWALFFKVSVALETLNDLIAQIHKGLWTQRFRLVIDFSFWCQRWFPKFQLLEKLQYLDSIVKDKVRSTKQLICFQNSCRKWRLIGLHVPTFRYNILEFGLKFDDKETTLMAGHEQISHLNISHNFLSRRNRPNEIFLSLSII